MYRSYSTADLCSLVPGISARQLQWWDEREFLEPDREDGRNRSYSIDDALTIAIVSDLRNRGLSLQRLRPIIRRLHVEVGRRLIWLVQNDEHPYLLVDGKNLSAETNPIRLLDALSTSKRHCHVVNVYEKAAIFAVETHHKAFRHAV